MFGAEGVAAILDWKPQGSTSEGSIVSSSRKPISALSPQVGSFWDILLMNTEFSVPYNLLGRQLARPLSPTVALSP